MKVRFIDLILLILTMALVGSVLVICRKEHWKLDKKINAYELQTWANIGYRQGVLDAEAARLSFEERLQLCTTDSLFYDMSYLGQFEVVKAESLFAKFQLDMKKMMEGIDDIIGH